MSSCSNFSLCGGTRQHLLSPLPASYFSSFVMAHIHKNSIMKDLSFVKISAVNGYKSFQCQANKHTSTLIVSARSSRNQYKNGEEISVNINQRINSVEDETRKKNMSGRIHTSKVKGSKKVFIKLIRNKRNYRDDLDLLINEDC